MDTDTSASEVTTTPRRIPLYGRGDMIRAWALVDEDDYERLAQYRWGVRTVHGAGYAMRPNSCADRRDGKPFAIRMHREVMGVDHGDRRLEVDHISRDTLDNRKGNLRLVTHQQNRQNTSGWHNSTSRYRGVSWDKSRGKWKAQGKPAHGNNVLIGRFDTEEAAAEAARAWRAEHMPFATD